MFNYSEQQIDRLFLALGDQTRRQMLKMLTKEGLTVSELGEPFNMTKQSVSKHLKVLEDAGLVTKEKDGRIQHCNFNPLALNVVQNIVEEYSKFWSKQLDGLDLYIQSISKNKKGASGGKKTKS